jgi:hypothetical protein
MDQLAAAGWMCGHTRPTLKGYPMQNIQYTLPSLLGLITDRGGQGHGGVKSRNVGSPRKVANRDTFACRFNSRYTKS